jgi:hypothetical protein
MRINKVKVIWRASPTQDITRSRSAALQSFPRTTAKSNAESLSCQLTSGVHDGLTVPDQVCLVCLYVDL